MTNRPPGASGTLEVDPPGDTQPGRSTKSRRARILCVDDEPQVLAGLETILGRKYDVRTATSGLLGLQALTDEGPFTVVVSDYRMPGMDGAEFLAEVRKATPDTLRILLTGQASLDGAIAAVNSGNVFRFLTKPCAPADLVGALDDAIDQARLVATDRDLLERKLEAMAAHLVYAERMQTLSTLAGVVAHELQNMLQVLQGSIEGIQGAMAAGEPADRDDVELLCRVREHVVTQASNLEHLARPPTNSSTTDLGAVVADTIGMLRSARVLRDIEVKVVLPERTVGVRIDRTPLEQILVNALSNAAEAVALNKDHTPQITVRITRDPAVGMATCCIEDNGPGVDPGHQDRVFDPFFSTKPRERGTGMGLFVIRQILSTVQGSARLRSHPGEGASLELRLPLGPSTGASS